MSQGTVNPLGAGGQELAAARAGGQAALTELILSFDQLCYQRQFHKLGRLPNFVGVGAGRTGTTTLYAALRRHPQVYMSPIKEINYFGIRESSVRPHGLDQRDYALFFAGSEDFEVVGEISPIYLTHGSSAHSMREQLGPDLKIIIQLREPVSRLVSQFFHHLEKHGIDDVDEYIRQAVETYTPTVRTQTHWFTPAKALDQSLYADAVQSYLELFGPEQVLVLLYEDLVADQAGYLGDVCRFLGVDEVQAPVGVKNRADYGKGPRRQISPDVEANIRAYFAPDVERLEEIIGRDLGRWRMKAA